MQVRLLLRLWSRTGTRVRWWPRPWTLPWWSLLTVRSGARVLIPDVTDSQKSQENSCRRRTEIRVALRNLTFRRCLWSENPKVQDSLQPGRIPGKIHREQPNKKSSEESSLRFQGAIRSLAERGIDVANEELGARCRAEAAAILRFQSSEYAHTYHDHSLDFVS